jgi:hypothetical protein
MGHRPMNRDDIAALAEGMVPFVREVVTEALDKRMGGNGSQSTVRDGRVWICKARLMPASKR